MDGFSLGSETGIDRIDPRLDYIVPNGSQIALQRQDL
jgi:hypothetical protein